MLGLAANVLARHLTQDDPLQSAAATQVMERRLTAQEPGFVSVVAMAELAWVLERTYGFSPAEIAGAIERLLQTEFLEVEAEQEVFSAMVALKAGQAAFADALIAALDARAGCARTLTFDRKAARRPAFELL
jgi:predicted nucleic-acid-binding protein